MIRTVAKLYLAVLILGAVVTASLVRVDIGSRIWPLSHHPRLIALFAVASGLTCAIFALAVSIAVAMLVVIER